MSDDHPGIGQPLGIRLMSLNQNLWNNDGNDHEVDFDNVQIDAEPMGSFVPGLVPVGLWVHAFAGPKESKVREFTIEGRGRKKVLLVGRGVSLSPNVRQLIKYPSLVLKRGRRSVAENDSWLNAENAAEIRTLLADAPLTANDSAILVELSAGTYRLELSDQRGGSGFGRLELHDASPGSRATFQADDPKAAEFTKMWSR
ncbi:MAG: hypothetical protein AAF236_10335 [Verrucomicrobiota bacterium]